MKRPANDPWAELVDAACAYTDEQQRAMREGFDLGSHERYDYDLDDGRLWFSRDGVAVVETRILVAGSISTISNTWLWSWANPHLPHQVTSKVALVREYGLERGFDRLVNEKWGADETDGWLMSAIACHILEARGVYRSPVPNGSTFLLMFDPVRCRNSGRGRPR